MAISSAEIGIGSALSCPVTNFIGNDEVFIGVLYCSLEFIKAVISSVETGIGLAFTYPVTNFLGNAEVLIVALYCSLEFF